MIFVLMPYITFKTFVGRFPDAARSGILVEKNIILVGWLAEHLHMPAFVRDRFFSQQEITNLMQQTKVFFRSMYEDMSNDKMHIGNILEKIKFL